MQLKRISDKPDLLALLFFFLLAVVVAGRGLFQNEHFLSYDIIFNKEMYGGDEIRYSEAPLGDSITIHYPHHYYFWESLKKGNWTEYNPYTILGVPVKGFSEGRFLLSIVSLFVNTGVGITVSTILMLTLSGFFMYIFLRSFKVNLSVAIFGGILWMLNSHTIAWLQFPQHLATELWIPLVFYLYRKYLLQKRIVTAILAAIVLFLFINSGYFVSVIYTLLYLAIFCFVLLVREFIRKRNLRSLITQSMFLLTMTLIPLLLSSYVLLSTKNSIDTGLRGSQSSRLMDDCEICDYKKVIKNLGGFLSPDIYGNEFEYSFIKPRRSTDLINYSRYFGVIPLIVLPLVLFLRKRKFWALLFILLSVSFLLAVYGFPVFTNLFALIPYIQFSTALRVIVIIVFGFIVAACLIIDELFEVKITKRRRLATVLIAALISVSLMIFTLFLYPSIYHSFLRVVKNLKIYKSMQASVLEYPYRLFIRNAFFLCFGFIAVLALLWLVVIDKIRHGKYLFIAIMVFTIFDLGRFAFFFNPTISNSYDFPKFPGIDLILQDKDVFRVHIAKSDRHFIGSNTNMVYGLEEIEGFRTTIDHEYVELYKAAFRNVTLKKNGLLFTEDISSELLDILNVKYVISENHIKATKDLEVVYQDEYLTIYENSEFLSRFFLASRYEVEKESENIIKRINETNFDEEDLVILDSLPDEDFKLSGKQGSVKYITMNTESAYLKVDDPDGGWLIFSQRYDSNWKVFIDDQESELYKAYGFLMASYIPAGNHEVRFEYNDNALSLFSTIKIIAFSILTVVSGCVFYKKRDKKWGVIFILLLIIIMINSLPILLDSDINTREMSKYLYYTDKV